MVEITFLRYIHKNTVLHRMDARLKLAGMLVLSLAAGFASEWPHYAALFLVLLSAFLVARLPFKALLKDLKFFGLIIFLVLVVNAFKTPGAPFPYPGFPGFSIQGAVAGLRFAGRLIVIIMICTIMTGTTSLMTLKKALEWYLRPVPFVPEARIATMIGLTFMLIPLIFHNYREMMNAQKSRGLEGRKNPVRRIKFIVFPLLDRTLRRTEEIVYAMEARCYSEVRTRAVFQSKKSDWLLLGLCLAVFFFVIYRP